MRDRQFAIDILIRGLQSVYVVTAPEEARQRLADDAARDIAPPPFLAALWLLMRVAEHEGAHAWYGWKRGGWRVRRTILRSDGTGATTIEGCGTDYETEVHRIVFALVGLACDLREPYSDVGSSYDLLSARLRVDALNARAIGAPVTFEHVATLAVTFVAENTKAIENIGLVLFHTRDLLHEDIELFGSAR